MADQSAIGLRDQRNFELAGGAQRIDDVLLGVTRVRRIQECRPRQLFDPSHISRSLASCLDVHRPDHMIRVDEE